MSTLSQGYIFAEMLYVGMVAYILYLFLRLALAGRFGKAVGLACAGGLILYFIFVAVDFDLRAYYFLGIALGALAAKYGIGYFIVKIKSKFFGTKVDTEASKGQNKK